MPTRTYITEEENRAPGFKAKKDRLTLLLGGNASGDVKLKPTLIFRSKNARALKNDLPVIWKSNKKAWVTAALFSDWFHNYLVKFTEKYNKEQNLSNKAILVLDNATGHPQSICDSYSHIKVIFLPPNTTPLLQPMDQGVISTFKAYYLRETLRELVTKTSSE